MATITARIPENLNNSLSSVARAMERPKSFLIHKAIEMYIKTSKEDLEDAEIAFTRMNKKNRKLYTSDEAKSYINKNCRG
jgi:predicted transcriptional regulator